MMILLHKVAPRRFTLFIKLRAEITAHGSALLMQRFRSSVLARVCTSHDVKFVRRVTRHEQSLPCAVKHKSHRPETLFWAGGIVRVPHQLLLCGVTMLIRFGKSLRVSHTAETISVWRLAVPVGVWGPNMSVIVLAKRVLISHFAEPRQSCNKTHQLPWKETKAARPSGLNLISSGAR